MFDEFQTVCEDKNTAFDIEKKHFVAESLFLQFTIRVKKNLVNLFYTADLKFIAYHTLWNYLLCLCILKIKWNMINGLGSLIVGI